MYITQRAAFVRNLGIAGINGAITLIILLIAPLGLAAVLTNTLLVTVASFINATVADRIIQFLQPSQIETLQATLDPKKSSSPVRRTDSNDLSR
ncbi:hypothetical protein NIES2119_22230 [[Phormidium ambiguum] IAM M-71]|uniref:Uncharacterized protein n=1 Tax=[Phormidium ambiguum] IAM M-71 TaxID=454136 RepID=A0A1U7IB93_9CYAN|nr:CRISPR-associated protein Csx18 [Phormidium ambiguum]OKH33825.1 hypothetical protein NIES2119_22230 [Phormidium ambiguum IAM M-71]